MPRFAVTVDDNGVQKRIVLESDTQPTEADVLSALRGQSQSSTPATPAQPSAPVADLGSAEQLQSAVNDAKNIGYARAAAAGGGGGFMTSPAIPEDVARKTGLGVVTTTARIAPPLIAGVLTGGNPAAMGLAGYAGERTAQSIEGLSGQRQQPDYGKELQSGIVAATPALGMVQGVAGPFAAGLYQAGRQAVVNASTAAFGDVIQKYIDEGRLPTWEEIGKEISLPALFGAGVGGASGAVARRASLLDPNSRLLKREEKPLVDWKLCLVPKPLHLQLHSKRAEMFQVHLVQALPHLPHSKDFQKRFAGTLAFRFNR